LDDSVERMEESERARTENELKFETLSSVSVDKAPLCEKKHLHKLPRRKLCEGRALRLTLPI
jgi:hypothetical protein